MSSTPETKPSTPAKSLGWTQSLFGGYFSSKKAGHVDSSTNSTSSKSQKPHRPSPKPFQNLEGFNTVHSPEQGESTPFTTSKEERGTRTSTSALPIQKFQQTMSPYASGRGANQTTFVPSKSPWKASTEDMGFSVGNLRPNVSQAGTGRINGRNFTSSDTSSVRPVDRVRRRANKYRPRGVFSIRRNRGQKATINKDEINKLMSNARQAIEPSTEKIESDKNFRTAFSNRRFRPGARLSDKSRANGRLPSQRPLDDENTKFVTIGKRDFERDDDQKDDESVLKRKKRRVNFGGEENDANMAIESLVPTPSKDTRSTSSKRKATPYKEITQTYNDKIGENSGDDEMTPSISDRKFLKARSPSKNLSAQQPDNGGVESAEDFPVMPALPAAPSDFRSWSTPEQRESQTPVNSNRVISKNLIALADIPSIGPADISAFMLKAPPQFEQKPLFKGPKKDRTVGFDDSDDEEDETVQQSKRSKTETWKCKECGFDNDNDETYCQQTVKDSKGNPKKCGVSRSSDVILGWGNLFDVYNKGKIVCENCRVRNDKGNTKCVSCEAPLSSSNSSTRNVDSAAKTTKASGLGGSIGSSGFSFGGAASGGDTAGKISSTGFSFGGSPVAAAPALSESSTTTATAGFQFGAPAPSASSSASANGGFKFGAPAKVQSPTPAPGGTSSSGGFQFGQSEKSKSPVASSGFKFGAPTTEKPPAKADSGSETTATLFQFGAPTKSKSPQAATKTVASPSPALTSSEAAPKPFIFGSSGAAPAAAEKAAAPTSSTTENSGVSLFGNFAGSSTSSTPKFSFGTTTDSSATEKAPSVEPASKRKSLDSENKTGFGFPSATTQDKGSDQGAPAFSFGSSSSVNTSKTSETATPGFSFGGGSAATSSVTATAPTFSIGKDAGSSMGSSGTMPALGSVLTEGNDGSSLKKKRRSQDESNTASSGNLNAPFGTKESTDGPTTASSTTMQSVVGAPFVFGKPSTNSSKEEKSSTIAPSFGNAANNSLSASATPAPSFGSTPAPAAPISFGSTPALDTPAPAKPFAFGSTPAIAPAPALAAPFSFGSTSAPDTAQAAPFTFGSTPAPAPAPTTTPAAPFTFGSSTPAPAAPTFGSTGPTSAPTMTFGSTPAPGHSSGFGSTPAAAPAPFGASAPMQFGSSTPAAAPAPFGSAPAPTTQPFGNSTAPPFNNATGGFGSTQPAPMAFGGTAPPAQNPAPGGFGGGGFGQQQPPAAPNAGFNLGTGGGGGRGGATPGRRRILKARRPRPR